MENKKKYIWLYLESHKNTQSFYSDNGQLHVKPNRISVRTTDIVYITSNGGLVEKNFTRVVLKDTTELFFDGSMRTLEEKLNVTFVEINKSTRIRMKYFTQSLGIEYVFSDYLETGLKVNKTFRPNVKKYLGYEE